MPDKAGPPNAKGGATPTTAEVMLPKANAQNPGQVESCSKKSKAKTGQGKDKRNTCETWAAARNKIGAHPGNIIASWSRTPGPATRAVE